MIGTASAQARQGFIYTPHYAASKFGVVGLTQSLSRAVAGDGITPKKDQRLARIVGGGTCIKKFGGITPNVLINSIGLDHSLDVAFLASDGAAHLGNAQTNSVRSQLAGMLGEFTNGY